MLDILRDQSLPFVCAALFALLLLDGMMLIGLVIPADPLIVLAGTTADTPAEAAVVLASGLAGCLAGASAGHLLGSRYGSRLRHGRLGARVGEHRWEQATAVLRRSGPALALSYFLPVMDSLTPVLAGTFGMPYRRYIFWVVLGGAAWVSTYTIAGFLAADFGDVYLVAVVALVLIAGSSVVRRRLSRRTAQPEEPVEHAPIA
ncbi:hypothetical protein Pth03_66780 [Planotetraspora thailandica]|uniref:VTT domain-containing protein n=1 Tax=Planotetraspora thailandica TaxID=487172 RepID=A0A8J4DCZ6_9ACTN|nr:VTT domain-containing protein [Planotetraspora thailandica]GII58289.1 hypothetical protein Pth03_66780 [Planotetraspora thailandica]